MIEEINMTTIFTKADIESMYITLEKLGSTFEGNKLQSKLDVLKARGFYVVDVSLVYNYVGSTFLVNTYLIRFVKPKYEVRMESQNYDSETNDWTSTGSKSIGLYSSQEVAQSVVENKEKDGFKATMVVHSPLDLPL
jgi:hypothetical protein